MAHVGGSAVRGLRRQKRHFGSYGRWRRERRRLRLRELSLTPSVSIELPIPGYDGTRIALAAAGERVAVAWLNESSGAEASAPGGFALLACSE